MADLTVGNDITATNVVSGSQHIVNHYYAGRNDQDLDVEARRTLQTQIDAYLKWLRDYYAYIELRGIERKGESSVVKLKLDTAYVPLAANLQRPKQPMSRLPRKRVALDEADGDLRLQGEAIAISLNKVASLGQQLVIIGGPGSGKTTVLLHMAWALASSLLDRRNTAAQDRLGLTGDLPLPIFLPLERFAHHLRTLRSDAPVQDRTLSQFITSYLIGKDAGRGLPVDFFSRLLQHGQDVILLLDGLDEVANEDERAVVRAAVESLVAGKDALRTLVTCRSIAYKSIGTALGAEFKEIRVQRLDFEQHISPMVRQAYACIYAGDADESQRCSTDLLHSITALEQQRSTRQGDDADPLVDSPLMVRLLIIVHHNERVLPDERASLFEKAVNALLQVDYGREETVNQALRANSQDYLDMAQHLAWHMHQQGKDQGREIDEPAIKALFKVNDDFRGYLSGFLLHTRNRGGLLEEREGSYRFIHLAFQEFLVARYLREVIGADGVLAMLAALGDARLSDPWWREPILLMLGYRASTARPAARNRLLALAKAGSNPMAKLSAAELAASAALEWRDSGPANQQSIATQIVQLLNDAAIHRATDPVLRNRAGVALARLGDPRQHITEVDAMHFCVVPHGAFVMGSRKADADAYADEQPQNPRYPLDYSYAIGQHPVSQAQYAAFVNEGGYANPAYWGSAIADGMWADGKMLRQVLKNENNKTMIEAEPDNAPHKFGDPFDLPNHPVVGVCWYEAQAFCAWLTARWQAKGWLTKKQRVTLPNEPEWEKAARGGLQVPATVTIAAIDDLQRALKLPLPLQKNTHPERQYAYGNTATVDVPDANCMNYDNSKINSNSTSGAFLLGASPYGTYDLCGNVWEWTRSAWGKWTLKEGRFEDTLDYPYPYVANDKRENLSLGWDISRVVRGGSWFSDGRLARVAFRYGYLPADRNNVMGFRVVVVSAPV